MEPACLPCHPGQYAIGPATQGRSAPPQAGRDADEKTMRQVQRWVDNEDDQAGANRQTASLAALALTLFLVVICVGLVNQLRYKATIEDCLLSGRTNCGVSIIAIP
jgi:hypothetical protein